MEQLCVVSTPDSSIREVILSWDFVNTVESIGYNTSNKRNEDKLDYGESWDQNQLINLVSGHTRGIPVKILISLSSTQDLQT